MCSTYSPLFYWLATRWPDVSHPSLRFLYIFGNPGLLCAARAGGCWARAALLGVQSVLSSSEEVIFLSNRGRSLYPLLARKLWRWISETPGAEIRKVCNFSNFLITVLVLTGIFCDLHTVEFLGFCIKVTGCKRNFVRNVLFMSYSTLEKALK